MTHLDSYALGAGESAGAAGRRRVAAELGPVGAVAGSVVFAAAVLLALGLLLDRPLMLAGTMLVACVAIYAWSRAVEGRRRANDRVVTMAIASAFALAIAPADLAALRSGQARHPGASTSTSSPSRRAA